MFFDHHSFVLQAGLLLIKTESNPTKVYSLLEPVAADGGGCTRSMILGGIYGSEQRCYHCHKSQSCLSNSTKSVQFLTGTKAKVLVEMPGSRQD